MPRMLECHAVKGYGGTAQRQPHLQPDLPCGYFWHTRICENGLFPGQTSTQFAEMVKESHPLWCSVVSVTAPTLQPCCLDTLTVWDRSLNTPEGHKSEYTPVWKKMVCAMYCERSMARRRGTLMWPTGVVKVCCHRCCHHAPHHLVSSVAAFGANDSCHSIWQCVVQFQDPLTGNLAEGLFDGLPKGVLVCVQLVAQLADHVWPQVPAQAWFSRPGTPRGGGGGQGAGEGIGIPIQQLLGPSCGDPVRHMARLLLKGTA
jgi:hypothetical protein